MYQPQVPFSGAARTPLTGNNPVLTFRAIPTFSPGINTVGLAHGSDDERAGVIVGLEPGTERAERDRLAVDGLGGE